jgi:uncharacterized membrane protein YhaH (DUF805 family)
MIDNHNPYAPPVTVVADIVPSFDTDFQPVKIFSTKGRIGRLRYAAYALCIGLIGRILGIIVRISLVAAGLPPTAILRTNLVIMAIAVVIELPFIVPIAIQRSHDMNWSGWSVLFAFIPFVGLIWMFSAGTKGANRFGPPPPPNSTGVKIFFWVCLVLTILMFIAAIVIGAYQGYERAHAM